MYMYADDEHPYVDDEYPYVDDEHPYVDDEHPYVDDGLIEEQQADYGLCVHIYIHNIIM